jgi:hypothetical protein
MAKQRKIDNLHQTHGKVEKMPLTLDQIWGDTGESKYGTLDINEYEKYLNDLNKSDLQTHASKVGLVPIDDRETLVSRLKREFEKHASLYKARAAINSSVEISKEAKKILSEGK